jgi:hypothetical protein
VQVADAAAGLINAETSSNETRPDFK